MGNYKVISNEPFNVQLKLCNLFEEMLNICEEFKNKIKYIINDINRNIIKKELKEKITKNLINDIEEVIQKIKLGNERYKKKRLFL